MSWTHALRQIVINCYKYHGREDLLPAFTDDDDKGPVTQTVSHISNSILFYHASKPTKTILYLSSMLTTAIYDYIVNTNVHSI